MARHGCNLRGENSFGKRWSFWECNLNLVAQVLYLNYLTYIDKQIQLFYFQSTNYIYLGGRLCPQHTEVSGPGTEPHHSYNPSHSSDSVICLTHCATRECLYNTVLLTILIMLDIRSLDIFLVIFLFFPL